MSGAERRVCRIRGNPEDDKAAIKEDAQRRIVAVPCFEATVSAIDSSTAISVEVFREASSADARVAMEPMITEAVNKAVRNDFVACDVSSTTSLRPGAKA